MNVCRPISTQNPFCASNAGACELGTLSYAGTIGITTNTFTFVSEGNLKMEFSQEYPGSCNSVINFQCDASSGIGQPVFVSLDSSRCYYTFSWKTAHACSSASGGGSGSGSGGLSGGSVFLIIFFVSFFLYFAIGMFYKRKRYHAEGVDMVPNVGFWRDLPYLVKDGVTFTISKIFTKN